MGERNQELRRLDETRRLECSLWKSPIDERMMGIGTRMRLLALFLTPLVLLQAQQATSEALRVLVLEGQASVNVVKTPVTVQPVVEVHDLNERPVEGAQVTFQLPKTGPGATFGNQQYSWVTKTNSKGQAAAEPMTANETLGSFNINVVASLGDRRGVALIQQTNVGFAGATVKPASSGKKKLWIILSIAAGAAAGGAIYYTRRDKTQPITVNPGGPVFGNP